MKICEVQITDAMRASARASAEELYKQKGDVGTLGDDPIFCNMIGFLGELIAMEVTKGVSNNTYEHDILIEGIKVDIKTAAQKSTQRPREDYMVSVKVRDIHHVDADAFQQCEYYGFCRVSNDMSVGWFLGVADKFSFLEKGRLFLKGRHYEDNNFKCLAHCINRPVGTLQVTKHQRQYKERC